MPLAAQTPAPAPEQPAAVPHAHLAPCPPLRRRTRAPCGHRLESLIRSITDTVRRRAADERGAAPRLRRLHVGGRQGPRVRARSLRQRKVGRQHPADRGGREADRRRRSPGSRPALENFYASLSDEQKAQLNCAAAPARSLGQGLVEGFRARRRTAVARAPVPASRHRAGQVALLLRGLLRPGPRQLRRPAARSALARTARIAP